MHAGRARVANAPVRLPGPPTFAGTRSRAHEGNETRHLASSLSFMLTVPPSEGQADLRLARPQDINGTSIQSHRFQ